GAARELLDAAGDCEQRRLGDGRAESQAEGEGEDEPIVPPAGCLLRQPRGREGDELVHHQPADGEERLLEPQEEDAEPGQHEHEARAELHGFRELAMQDDAVEEQHEGGDRHDAQGGVPDHPQDREHQVHASTAVYSITKSIGTRRISAIMPKPSVSGLRSASEEARPMPSAVTRGTVMTEEVTAPES